MLYEQVTEPKPKTKIKWKIDLKYLGRETESDHSDLTLEQKLERVVEELESQELVGSIEDCKPYIKVASDESAFAVGSEIMMDGGMGSI